ncbi:MAG TPA: hypothetical protein VH540_25175 [Ktedonobacterales bacterium]|jgi:hypothetical protein
MEDELIARTKEVIQELLEAEQSVTKRGVCRRIQIGRDYLKSTPRLALLIEEAVKKSRETTQERKQLNESRLALKVVKAKQILEKSGQRVTLFAVSKIVGKTVQGLSEYPSIRAIFDPIAQKTRFNHKYTPGKV